MDIGKSFSFIFEDERWISKVAIGGLVFLIPLLGQIVVMGYMLKVAQNVAQGNPNPLPEWGEFGDHLMRGLHAFLITIVYYIPYIVVYVIFICITTAISAGAERSDSAGAMGGILACILVPFIFISLIVSMVLTYAGQARYVVTNSLGEALKFGEVFALVRSKPGPWLMLLLINILAGLFAMVGLIACGIGVLFTGFMANCVVGHALGQTVAKEGMLAGGYSQTPPPYGTPPTYQ